MPAERCRPLPAERSPVRELLRTVERLAEIASSDLPEAEKRGLLAMQIGTAQFWAEQVCVSTGPQQAVSATAIPGPKLPVLPARRMSQYR
jgi:hypothetical protein